MNLNVSRLQLIESICKNGCKETIDMITRTPPDIIPQCASNFLLSYSYVQIAKMTRFVRLEDGTFIRL